MTKIEKKSNYLVFFNFIPLIKFGSMESIHMDGSFDILMNEVKFTLEERTNEERFERS